MQNRILMLCYYFAPSAAAGAYRSTKFAKYLSHLGWTPTVVTVDDDGNDIDGGANHSYLNEHILHFPRKYQFWPRPVAPCRETFDKENTQFKGGNGYSVIRRIVANISRPMREFWNFPDRQRAWSLNTYLYFAKQTYTAKPFDIIYASGSPFSCFLTAYWLSQKWQIPLVLDYRDPWASWKFPGIHPFAKFVENKIINATKGTIHVTQELLEQHIRAYPQSHCTRNIVLPNGIDYDDGIAAKAQLSDNQIIVIYAGSLYGARNPLHFLEGMYRASLELNNWNLKFKVLGSFDNKAAVSISRSKYLSLVEYLPRVAKQNLSSVLAGADFLLLRPEVSNVNPMGTMTSKIFDYFRGNRPILHVSDYDTSAAKLIRDSKTGFCLPNRAEDIKEFLVRFAQDRAATLITYAPDEDVLMNYDRAHLSERLSAFLRECRD